MKFNVTPMTCGRCVRAITDALTALDPSARVRADVAAGEVEVEGALDADAIVAALAATGYTARPAVPGAGAAAAQGCCGSRSA